MTNEQKIGLKLAMPAALGLFLVSYIAMMVGLVMFGFGFAPNHKEMVFSFLPYAAAAFGLVTLISFLDNNLFDSVLFGMLAVFFWSLPGVIAKSLSFADMSMFILFAAAFLLIMAFISINLPIRMITGVLVLAGITFLFLGLWVNGAMEPGIVETLTASFAVLTALLSAYLPTALIFNSMSGKQSLPVL